MNSASKAEIDFVAVFKALTGNGPFPWQQELYVRFAAGKFPPACNLPTGLGKTSVIPIWLIALANHPDRVPRRLVYVVNRRTVVDQATVEAKDVRDRLPEDLRLTLRKLCADQGSDNPLAISTLRGQYADNREWSADPARPAVIVGTVDMIGSRLLFSGYGVGYKAKPLHAGFLGQDVLLVHDEAHLEPAFQKLIEDIRDEQRRCGESLRPFHVMALSATSRGEESFTLTPKDRVHPVVKARIEANKTISLHEIDDEKKLVDSISDLALSHSGSKDTVLVYVRTVEAVEKVAERLNKAKHPVEMLTGTMRGKERDDLIEKPIFKRFLPGTEGGDTPAYLVCTSAGEVGVNISSDHLVCDLSTFESMAQRFGRVNRFGKRGFSRIDVVHPKAFDEKPISLARRRTLDLLRKLNGDGSPASLGSLTPAECRDAYSPPPEIPLTSDILYDTWAMTSIRGKLPGRPTVEPYLHGVSEWEPPQTQVAWREEVCVITGDLLTEYPPEDLLEDYPLKPHEILRDRSDRVFKHLTTLAATHPDRTAWLVDEEGKIQPLNLKELADKDRKQRINSRTVILPPDVGGLLGGLLSGNAKVVVDDVADEWYADSKRETPRRKRVWDKDTAPDGMRLIRELDTRPDDEEVAEECDGEAKRRYWRWYVRLRSADDDSSKTSTVAVPWKDHTDQVTGNVKRITAALGLSAGLRGAIEFAAVGHDLGKKRAVWQRSIGNRDRSTWYAKSGSGKAWKTREVTDYRHEFGSLLDILQEVDFAKLDDEQKELALHVIATHHGRGRPHFATDEIFDPKRTPEEAEWIAVEIPRRFARLQRKYGRWGLAYLESLLRAADWNASANPTISEEAKP